jgi:hypothetical protein
MLLEKPRSFPCVMVFKLSTGEEIIANVTEDKQSNYVVEKPLQMAMGQQGPQFAPFMMMADMDKVMPLNKALLVSYTDANPKIEEQYRTITSTIALPKKQSIIV